MNILLTWVSAVGLSAQMFFGDEHSCAIVLVPPVGANNYSPLHHHAKKHNRSNPWRDPACNPLTFWIWHLR
jgi:hypothetical protein